jgi:copper transport protein
VAQPAGCTARRRPDGLRPRFSNVAIVSVLVLIGSGTCAAVLHMPTLASFWQTSYGKTFIVKICLLATAILLASVNPLRNTPRLAAYRKRPELGPGAATLLGRLVSGEVLPVATAVGVGAVLSRLAPPSKALASIGQATAHVGPGSVLRVVNKNGYKLTVRVAPNRAAVPNAFSVQSTRDGKPVRNAEVTTSFTMLDMEMGQQAYRLPETSPGTYEHRAVPALVMVTIG